MDEGLPRRVERVGVVATDPLRVLGLTSIFPESAFELVQLSVPGALDDKELTLVLIDSSCTPHLFELIAAFRKSRPMVKLIVLGSDISEEFVAKVIGAGAKGYLPLTAQEREVRLALESVRDGSVWAPRKVLARLLENQRAETATVLPHFTARERQILKLLHAGRSNREIALALLIDPSTVKAHLGRLMRKVGVSNRIALTIHPFTQTE